MQVQCEVMHVDAVQTDRGTFQGVCVICRRCDKEVEVAGTSARSVRRGLVMLREGCDMGEENFYVAEDAEDD